MDVQIGVGKLPIRSSPSAGVARVTLVTAGCSASSQMDRRVAQTPTVRHIEDLGVLQSGRASRPFSGYIETILIRVSRPTKSCGLRVYSASLLEWATAAMRRSATRERCERPAATTAATTWP
jgi:hypothetical protein